MAKRAQPRTCVIYVRMSQDRSGQELGVERHERECRELAQKLDMDVVHVYSDNDQSATSGKARPEFEAMLGSKPEAIVAWHQDRLLRLTKDLERVIDVGAPVYFVTSAENGLDLASPAGRAVARTVAAWSQYEGEQKRLRQLSKNQQLARHGHWQFSLRPYGYKRVDGKIVQVPEEIEILREGYERALTGISYRQIALSWNERGIKPLRNERWSRERVQRLLENPHYGGVLTYQGEIVELEEGRTLQWTPAIDERTWNDFREFKLNRKRKRSWAATPKHLMSGMLTCGVCSGQMFSASTDVRRRTRERNAKGNIVRKAILKDDGARLKQIAYRCQTNHCVAIRGDYVDDVARAVVLKTLADERIVRALRPNDDLQPLQDEITDLQRRRNELTELVGEGLVNIATARDKLRDLSQRLDRLNAKLSGLRAESPLSDIRLAESIPARWDALSVLERRRIISDLGLRLSINRADMGPRRIDPMTGEMYTERAWSLLRIGWTLDT